MIVKHYILALFKDLSLSDQSGVLEGWSPTIGNSLDNTGVVGCLSFGLLMTLSQGDTSFQSLSSKPQGTVLGSSA